MLDISTLSVLFLTDSVSNSSSPVICLAMKSFSDTSSSLQSPEDSESKNLGDPGNGLTFIMTRNGHIVVIDSSSGNMISSWPMHSQKESTAVSMHIIGEHSQLKHKILLLFLFCLFSSFFFFWGGGVMLEEKRRFGFLRTVCMQRMAMFYVMC